MKEGLSEDVTGESNGLAESLDRPQGTRPDSSRDRKKPLDATLQTTDHSRPLEIAADQQITKQALRMATEAFYHL